MKFNELKRQIYTGMASLTFDDTLGLAYINKIITGALLYSFISKLMMTDSSYQGQTLSLVNQYGKTYVSMVEGMRNKYIAYQLMKNYIQNKMITSFLDIDETDITEINNYYLDKTKVVRFDPTQFSQYMYNIEDISLSDYDRLRKIHFNVIAPIISTYLDKYNKSPNDIELYAISINSDIMCKEIIFRINDIKLSQIISDIERMTNAMKYIQKVEVYYNYVYLLIK